MNQQYTSAGTSINSVKLPAIYSVLAKYGQIEGCSILDYGCGKYTSHIADFVAEKGVAFWYGVDRYNQTSEHNAQGLSRGYDVSILSNVINVIKEEQIIANIIDECLWHAPICFISVYEGDKSGIGKATQNGKSWQRNQKKADYIEMLENMGFYVHRWHGAIAITRGWLKPWLLRENG